jgi:hypothetical protein
VIFRRGSIGPDPRPGRDVGILDGGQDAPLSRRARLLYRSIIAFVAVVGAALVLWLAVSN